MISEIVITSRDELSYNNNIFNSLDISDDTKLEYLSRLSRFFKFASTQTINRDLLLRYKQYLRDDNTLGISSKNKYLTTARIALRELYRQGLTSIDLSVGVSSFQQNNKHRVNGLSEEEVSRICDYLQEQDKSFKNIRLRAIISLLFFQGLRQIEICRLNFDDIDLAKGVMKVLGKGRDDKEYIHLHPTSQKALKHYLRASHAKYGPAFYSLSSKNKGDRLSTRGLRQIVQSLFSDLDIEKTVHGSRHFFTTELIKYYKSDLTTVARFTRHNSLNMLQIYNDEISSESDPEQLAKAFQYDL
jgi:possible integrase